MAKEQIGIICEQGDLGLHFTPLNESEAKTVKNNEKDKDKDKNKCK